jgi:hypothetical protein
MAAARIGTSFASASSRARSRSCDVGRWIWSGTERRNSSESVRTSASTQTANGSVLSGWATQILQGELSRSARTLHFSSEPRHYQQARAERVAHLKNR